MTSDERSEFEAKLIEKKLLLPSKQGRRLEPEADEFAAAATEFRAAKHAAHPAIEDAAKRKTKDR
jgi:hypothetical protein